MSAAENATSANESAVVVAEQALASGLTRVTAGQRDTATLIAQALSAPICAHLKAAVASFLSETGAPE